MLPFLPGLNGGVAGSPVQVPPPHSLRLPKPPIKAVRYGGGRPSSSGVTAAQKAGLRYEAKLMRMLQGIFGDMIQVAPEIHYEDATGPGLAIPDAIIIASDWVMCVEAKSQHMPEAWWQLRKKYEPLLRFLFPGERILLLEICRSLDASMPYPEAFTHVEELPYFINESRDGELGVFQWKL